VLITQDAEGLVFRRPEEIASITPEYADRWRVVDAWGCVSYLPTAPPAGPWVALGESWVNPRWLRPQGEFWVDPAGFCYPRQTLGQAPTLPQEAAAEGLPCAAPAVVSLIGHGKTCHWHTDEGDIPWNMPAVQAAPRHPHLFQMRQGIFLNLRRLKRIRKKNPRTVSPYLFEMDTGEVYELNGASEAVVANRLGLTELDKLQPYHRGFWRRQLRAYPYEISQAPAARLLADFASPDVLLANLVWQVYLWRLQGLPVRFGLSFRDAHYNPNKAALFRAGFLDCGQGGIRKGAKPEDELFVLWERVLLEMVSDGLFSYTDLGFIDEYGSDRGIGAKHPHILLVAEKSTQGRMVAQLARELGLSWVITKGVSTLVGDLFLANALKAATNQTIRSLFVVDFDEGGWSLGNSMVKHLQKWGIQASPPEFVCWPSHFSAEELEMIAIPRNLRDPATATRVRKWVAEMGGLNGKAMGISVNYLQPYERLKAAVLSVL